MSSIIQSRRSIMRVQFQFPPIERFLEFQSSSKLEFSKLWANFKYEEGKRKRERENWTKKKKVAREIYLPYCAARSSADSPRLLRMLGSHPYCSSCATTSVCPYCAAQCNAVSLSFVYDHTGKRISSIRFSFRLNVLIYTTCKTNETKGYGQSIIIKLHTIVRYVLN